MINYRDATPSDAIDLLGLVQEYCTENNIEYDNASIKRYMDFQLGKIPTIVAVDKDKVIGVISIMFTPHPFNQTKGVAKKIACFVDKEYRDQGIGKELITKAEDFAKLNKCAQFYFSSSEAPDGYRVFESEYVKDL